MLKDQLLQEAQNIDATVELDSIFESADLSPEAKAKFSTVFEATVKQSAVKLAESHIAEIAEKADALVAEGIEAETTKLEESLVTRLDEFLSHLSAEWLAENKVNVERGIKADLFESLLGNLKAVFVEHNVVVPAESVDVVAEMEEELQEAKTEHAKLFGTLTESRKEFAEYKRATELKEATADLTETQKEKVGSLVEGLEYSDLFVGKVSAIVEMVKGSKEATTMTEATDPATIVEGTDINTSTNDPAGLNYQPEVVVEATAQPNTRMNQYVRASQA